MNKSTDYEHLLSPLADCTICPHECHANRLAGATGVCGSDASFNIASICIHRGEEPVISGEKGICNIFFTNCNLQCIYCQNHQISNNRCSRTLSRMDPTEVVEKILSFLQQGITHVGFVSPSHFVPQVKVIIRMIMDQGIKPVWVYNSNGYDKVETLKSLEGIIDVYLPDFKYSDASLGVEYSRVQRYPEIALKALKEMYRQKGSSLHTNSEGLAVSGIIVRHLVLPGHAGNSVGVIRMLAEEISPRVNISLMSQYYPASKALEHTTLGRTVEQQEYQQVLNEMELQGMYNGWIQEFDSNNHYRPDFNRGHPFENKEE